jgi:hypothetical protein
VKSLGETENIFSSGEALPLRIEKVSADFVATAGWVSATNRQQSRVEAS